MLMFQQAKKLTVPIKRNCDLCDGEYLEDEEDAGKGRVCDNCLQDWKNPNPNSLMAIRQRILANAKTI